MTKEEYDAELKEIEIYNESQKLELAIKYANANNPHKVGDTVTDHSSTVLIDKIKVSRGIFGGPPYCVYYGLELTKKLVPRKDKRRIAVHQINLQEAA